MPLYMPDFQSWDSSDRNLLGVQDFDEQTVETGARDVTQHKAGLIGSLAAGVFGGVVDTVDSIASSLTGGKVERNTVNNAVLNTLDSPGLTDFFFDNYGAVEVGSGIASVALTEFAAGRIGEAMKASQNVGRIPVVGGWMKRLEQLDMYQKRALATVRQVDLELAKRGAQNMEQFLDATPALVSRWNPVKGTLTTTKESSIFRSAAKSRAKRITALKSTVSALGAEARITATSNQNGFLFDDDVAVNLMWAGAGIGVGTAIGTIGASYAMRRFAHTNRYTDTVRRALDAGDLDRYKDEAAQATGSVSLLTAGQELLTDRITVEMLQNKGRLSKAKGTSGTLFSNLESSATQNQGLAFEMANMVTAHGWEGVPLSGFGLEKNPVGQAVKVALSDDPAALYGVAEITRGNVVDNLTGRQMGFAEISQRKRESIDNRIFEIQRELDPEARKRKRKQNRKPLTEAETEALHLELHSLRQQKGFDHLVYRNGEYVPVEDLGSTPMSFSDPIVSKRMENQDMIYNVNSIAGEPKPKGYQLGIDTTGTLYFPKGKGLHNLDHGEMINLYRMGNKVAQNIVSASGKAFKIPNKFSWFHLDLAEHILRESNNDLTKVVFPEGMTRESAQLESLALKASAIKKLENRKNLTPYLIREYFNLPQLTSYERGLMGQSKTPLEVILRGVTEPEQIRSSSLYELKRVYAQAQSAIDFRDFTPDEIPSLLGDSFRLGVDSQGNPLEPFMVARRPFDRDVWTKDNLAMRMATQQMGMATQMIRNEKAPITRDLVANLLADPDARSAAQTSKLQDLQRQSTLPIAPNAPVSRGFRPFETVYSENPVMLAAQRLVDKMGRQMRAAYTQVVQPHADTFSMLRTPKNRASKIQLENYISHRMGWDLKPKPIGSSETGYRFLLDQNSQKNRDRWRQTFGEEMPKGAVLSSPVKRMAPDTHAINYSQENFGNRREIVLDDLGLAGAKAINDIMQQLRLEKNSVLRARGFREINKVDWYVPPTDANDELVGLIYTKDNRLFGRITADTPEQYERERQRIIKNSEAGALPNGLVVRRQKDVQDFLTLWERAQLDLLDPTLTPLQPGRQNLGKSQNPLLELNSLDRVLDSIQKSYIRHSRDVIETYFMHQINAAKARDAVASSASKRNRSALSRYAGKFVAPRTIHGDYVLTMTGQSPLRNEDSWVGRISNLIDLGGDYALRGVFDFWHRAPGLEWYRNRLLVKEYNRLVDQLGERMPFQDSQEYLERVFAAKSPPEFKEVTAKLNRFTASMILRWGEIAHPIMNMAGVINALPAVIRQMSPKPGESIEQYSKRVGHLATVFSRADGTPIGTFDTAKLIARSMKNTLSSKRHPDFDYIVKMGYGKQEVAEFVRQFGALKHRDDWTKFVLGDPNSDHWFMKKGLDGWMGILSDKSEDYSRLWSHMAGLEVAEFLGIANKEAKHAFAHDFANKAIANYNPLNRPEIFQGGAGSLLGLFQSFIWNYYHRMYRYIETGDLHSAARQYAMQSGLFGLQTAPGWQEFNDTIGWASNHEENPYDGIYNRFDRKVADLLSAGTLSNLPVLFGGEGVALYTRGDTRVQVPGLVQFPVANVATKIWDAVTQGIELFSDGHPDISSQEISEIFARTIPNRPLSGMIEVLATGGTTDGSGQLVAEVNNWMEATYRMMGVRSLSDQKEIEAFYANKQAQESMLAKQARLLQATRSLIRAGNFDSLPSILEEYAALHHGDISNFRRWFKGAYESAVLTRGERQLLDTVDNVEKMDQVNRLLNAGVGTGPGDFVPGND